MQNPWKILIYSRGQGLIDSRVLGGSLYCIRFWFFSCPPGFPSTISNVSVPLSNGQKKKKQKEHWQNNAERASKQWRYPFSLMWYQFLYCCNVSLLAIFSQSSSCNAKPMLEDVRLISMEDLYQAKTTHNSNPKTWNGRLEVHLVVCSGMLSEHTFSVACCCSPFFSSAILLCQVTTRAEEFK